MTMETNKLSCKDLMIGDYVLVKPSKMIIKIVAIHSKTVAYHSYVNRLIWVEEGLLEPIILTPRILEKNGFEKIRTCDEKPDEILQCVEGDIIIEVGIYDPNFISISYQHETPDGIGGGELSSIVKVDEGKIYLHELQHALKLCGITHEINL